MSEVAIKQFPFTFFTLPITEAAADEVGDVLHAATATHVLKVDRGDLIVGRKTEVGQLCIAMNDRLKASLAQPSINRSGGLLERTSGHRVQFIRPSLQVPIGSRLPKTLAGWRTVNLRVNQKRCVKVRQPLQAGIELRFVDSASAD